MPTGWTEKSAMCAICTLLLDVPRPVHQKWHPACAKEADRLYAKQRWAKISEEERKKWQAIDQQRNQERRTMVLDCYGGKCTCCGETRKEFLCMDHINGGGLEHRKIAGMGTNMYRWIIRNNFPDTLRVLCHNCNMSLGFYGYCPHERESLPTHADFNAAQNIKTRAAVNQRIVAQPRQLLLALA